MKRFSIFLLLISLVACKKDDNPAFEDHFDRKALFSSLSSEVILPAFLDFVSASDSLQKAAIRFQQNPQLQTLQDFQENWKQAKLQSKKIELLKFGPLNDTKMYSQVDKWPTNENFIEAFISDNQPLTETFIQGKGATSKGLPAIEYLIFEEGSPADLLKDLQQTPRRVEYAVACCQNLYQKALEIASLWSPLGDNYQNFYNNNTINGLDGALNKTVNQMAVHLEFVANIKLGKPLGKELNTAIDHEKLEAWRSKFSKEVLIANLEIFKSLYEGKGPGGLGFDDYLNYLQAQKRRPTTKPGN